MCGGEFRKPWHRTRRDRPRCSFHLLLSKAPVRKSLSLGPSGAGLLHIASTTGPAAYRLIRTSRPFGRRRGLIVHVAVSLGIVVAAAAGIGISSQRWFVTIAPSPDELRVDLWTAFFAATIAALFIKGISAGDTSASDVIARSRRGVPADLISYARTLAVETQADPALVEAILLVENVQRPRWLRRLERLVGRVLPIETYGVMQVRSDRPISDRESVEIAVRERLAGKAVEPHRRYSDRLTRLIRSYNGNPKFVTLVEEIYAELRAGHRAG